MLERKQGKAADRGHGPWVYVFLWPYPHHKFISEGGVRSSDFYPGEHLPEGEVYKCSPESRGAGPSIHRGTNSSGCCTSEVNGAPSPAVLDEHAPTLCATNGPTHLPPSITPIGLY